MIEVLTGMVVMIAGAWLGAPTLTPIMAGVVVGLAWPARASRRAALAAVLAWGGILALAVARGDAIGTLAITLGGAMSVPGWALFVATLCYAALLSACAAWLGYLASPWRTRSIDQRPNPSNDHPP